MKKTIEIKEIPIYSQLYFSKKLVLKRFIISLENKAFPKKKKRIKYLT